MGLLVRYIAYFLLSSILIFHSAYAATTKIVNARMYTDKSKTRIVLSVSGPYTYKYFFLQKPERLVVDFIDVQLGTRLSKLPYRKSPVKNIRVGLAGKDNLRLVFDLKHPVNAKIFDLKPTKKTGARFVMDLTSAKGSPAKNKVKHTKANAQSSAIKRPKPRNVVVIIDPGHGGKDSGAIGPNRLYEKNVVLAISKYLYEYLKREPGITPHLTRSGDYYLTLRQRLKIARKDKGDIFIAIHADAFKVPSARGASVFALSQRGATSEAARWLAEKENYSELGGVDLDDYKGDMLRSVLINLSQTATINSSIQLGDAVLSQLGKVTRLHHSRIELARFVVLKSPDIPSILIETGFISNPYEEKRLSSSNYQRKLARAITRGVRRYFYANPPPGTWIAMKEKNIPYKVVRGDSLSGIAKRYKIPVAKLKKVNLLANDNIRVGQVLMIPKVS